MASQTLGRFYHSNALLLPDGRVLSAGGDLRYQSEIYSPPYLFKGATPDHYVGSVQRPIYPVIFCGNT